MKQKNIIVFLVLSFLFIKSSYAALELQVTQGVASAIPVAVSPFGGQSYGADDPTNIAAIIQTDLANSGRFKVMPVSGMKQTPDDLKTIDFDYWKQTNMNSLVVGKVQSAGMGRYKISFSLVDVYQGAQDDQAKKALISDEFTVGKNQLRQVAHHISDMIFEKLTGKKGIFSTRIAYVLMEQNGDNKRYLLEVADADGYSPKPILISSEPVMSPTWSPDGRKIAYVSFENKRAAIYVSDVASGQRQVLSNFDGINGAPAWSPDGRKMALVLSKTDVAKIYLMDIGSHQLTQLTDGPSLDTEPSFAPDGNSLIFTSNRGGGPQIYRIGLGGGSIKRMTFDGSYNATGSFTADGKQIVLLHGESGHYNIGLQDIASGALTPLTNSGDDSSPSVAPNGEMIVYADNSGARGVLGMVSIDGKIKIRLPAPDGNVREAAWSPFLNLG